MAKDKGALRQLELRVTTLVFVEQTPLSGTEPQYMVTRRKAGAV